MSDDKELIIEKYADNEVTEYSNTKVPLFLKCVYLVLPLWGLWWWLSYWDGSQGWLDRGYWNELQEAANTKVIEESHHGKVGKNVSRQANPKRLDNLR